MNYLFKDVLRILKEAGWRIKAKKGSHVQLTHPEKPGKVTIPQHGKRSLKPGTLNNIWKQAGLK